MMDIECYINYFLIKFFNLYTGQYSEFEYYHGCELDRVGIMTLMNAGTIVTFNGNNYDIPMLFCALAGMTNAQLKTVSNDIIGPGNGVRGMAPWQIESQYGISMPKSLDHIDLIEIAPGQASLKMYGAKLGSKKLQDLPYEHTRVLTRGEMLVLKEYCGNDLLLTRDLYLKFKDQIATRADLSIQYGMDMRSKSDAQIAEAAFKQLLGLSYRDCENIKEQAWVAPGTRFYYDVPDFIKFKLPELQSVLALVRLSPFTIQNNGTPKIDPHLEAHSFKIGRNAYKMTAGGLHSQESQVSHRADASYSLLDVDVASFYPKIISILKLYPRQLGAVFLTIFDGWIEVRIEYKNKKNKKKADTFKIKLNGTYGKTGSPYSIMYSPQLMIQVTVTGQLSLLMLIEMLHDAGIEVVSANTDGIVIKCPRHLHGVRDATVQKWQALTGFETEGTEYVALFSRDVNAYMAFKSDGTVKLKGAYAPPEPVASSWPNPHAKICVDAVCEYIRTGASIEKTIRACSDIRQFVSAQKVAGGGRWSVDGSYIGKAARWYYGAGQTGYIEYINNGNKVAKSQGAKPCMELPDVLPPDIDYNWYVMEAREILTQIACR